MGKRGPKPTPTATLKVRNSRLVSQRGAEPSPPVELPPAPKWLQGAALARWAELGSMLVAQGLLTRLDALALALLVDALGEYLDAREIVAQTGLTTETDNLNVIQHPAVGIMHRAWENVLKILREFGLTPSARSGVAVAPADKDGKDAKRRFFRA